MQQNTESSQSSEITQFIEQLINQTNRSVFMTGKAGTGKTTLLRKLVKETHKQAVIVAPTGIAALNAGGVTIHSFFIRTIFVENTKVKILLKSAVFFFFLPQKKKELPINKQKANSLTVFNISFERMNFASTER